MQAPTHVAFGLVFTVSVGTVLGIRLTPAVAALTTAGALLPDVDTTTSLVGKLCPPLSRLLERRFGHRTLTHSLLALMLITLPTLPLALVDPTWPAAFALGYLSHLLVDASNKSGVPLFFPSPLRAVLPRGEGVRIAVGSKAEALLFLLLLALIAILLPLHWLGFARALHALTRTTAGAIADYRIWEGKYEVWAEVDGIFRLSQRRVRQRYRILGVANAHTLVVDDPGAGTMHTVGTGESASIFPYGIRAEPGRAITVQTRTVDLSQELLGDLLRKIPTTGESFLLGKVRTPDTPVIKPEPEQYAALELGMHELELRYARPRALEAQGVATTFIVTGQVLIQTILPWDALLSALPPVAPPPREFDDITQLYIAHLIDPARELLVREGERVHRGQLLARLSYKDPEVRRRRHDAEAQLQERETALRLQEAKLRVVRALWSGQLAASRTVELEEAALVRAHDAIEHARRELTRMDEIARQLSEIRAPVDGQVLTIRIHAIHGSEGTALVRMLYRKAKGAP
jgi:membrane-bound metal-dependent hydrolase YbcI (DUF457 family)